MHNIKLWSPNNKKTNLHKFINQLDKSLNIKNYASKNLITSQLNISG